MSPEELQLLKLISERETSAFVPAGQGAVQAQRFDRRVESLLGCSAWGGLRSRCPGVGPAVVAGQSTLARQRGARRRAGVCWPFLARRGGPELRANIQEA